MRAPDVMKNPIRKCTENTINYAAGSHKALPTGMIRAGIYLNYLKSVATNVIANADT
jgi:hypothetical protein